jgi:hypothetical protein
MAYWLAVRPAAHGAFRPAALSLFQAARLDVVRRDAPRPWCTAEKDVRLWREAD